MAEQASSAPSKSLSIDADAGADVSAIVAQERRLRRDLGFWGLTAIGFSNIVGSGWLFAAMYAAQIAGPASLLCWLGAGLLCALIALVMVELGGSRPEGGGLVRWPRYSSGQLVGTVVGVSALLAVGANAAEITAIIQYVAHYVPALYHGHTLTVLGAAVGVAFSFLLTALNWFTVRSFARLNNVITVFKIVVPVLTVIMLLASGFHPGHLVDHGGFAPYGYAACLSALSAGGISYSVSGFQAPVDFSGEASDPRRTIPRSVLAGIAIAVVIYLALQLAFLSAVPDQLLGNGWHGVSFDSPFGQLALILNLQWLSGLLYVDAVLSPGGSANVGIAIDARHTYALAKNGSLPRWFMRVDERSGMPRRALVLNLAVLVVFLLPFGGWQQIVGVMGDMYLLTYASSAVAAATLRGHAEGQLAGWVPGMRWIAPLGFVVASEFVYWSGWPELRLALPLVLLGVPLFLALWRGQWGAQLMSELAKGSWVVCYLLILTLLSGLGSFSGADYLRAPWDSLLVAVFATGVFWWALRAGRGHLAAGSIDALAVNKLVNS